MEAPKPLILWTSIDRYRLLDGARSRTRTGTPLLARDFKSPASTDFAIRAVALCEGLDYIQPFACSQGTQKHAYGMKKAS